MGDSSQTFKQRTMAPKLYANPMVYSLKVHWSRTLECSEVADDSYLPELSFDFGVYLVTSIEILAGRSKDQTYMSYKDSLGESPRSWVAFIPEGT